MAPPGLPLHSCVEGLKVSVVGRCSLSLCGLRGGEGWKGKGQDFEFGRDGTDLSASRVTVAVPGRAREGAGNRVCSLCFCRHMGRKVCGLMY